MTNRNRVIYNIAGVSVPYSNDGGIDQVTLKDVVGKQASLYPTGGSGGGFMIPVEVVSVNTDLTITYKEVKTGRVRTCYWYRFWRRENKPVY